MSIRERFNKAAKHQAYNGQNSGLPLNQSAIAIEADGGEAREVHGKPRARSWSCVDRNVQPFPPLLRSGPDGAPSKVLRTAKDKRRRTVPLRLPLPEQIRCRCRRVRP